MKKLALLSVFVACSAHAQGVEPGTKPFAGVLRAGLCYSVFTSANVKTGSECAYQDSGNGAFEFRDRSGTALLRLTTSFAAPILELQGTGTWRSSGSLSIYDESGNDGSGSEATVHSVRVGGNERLAITNKGNLKSTGGVYTTVGSVLTLKSNLAAGAGPGIIFDTDNAITSTVYSWRSAGVQLGYIDASGNVAAGAALVSGNGLVTNNNGLAMAVRGQKSAGAGPDIVLDSVSSITGKHVSFRTPGVEYAYTDAATGGYYTTSQKAQTVGSWSGNTVGVVATGTSFLGGFKATSVVAFRNISCSWAVAGIAGTVGVVMRIRNLTDSTTLCTCTLGACTATAATPLSCDCNAVALAGKQYAIQYDPTAVTGTDCGTDPSGTFCTVEIAH